MLHSTWLLPAYIIRQEFRVDRVRFIPTDWNIQDTFRLVPIAPFPKVQNCHIAIITMNDTEGQVYIKSFQSLTDLITHSV